MALLDRGGAATAIYSDELPGGRLDWGELLACIESCASGVAGARRAGPARPGTWVCVSRRPLHLIAVLGCLGQGPAAVVEHDGPPAMFDALSAACPPGLVVCDAPDSGAARWAAASGVPVHLIGLPAGQPGPRRSPGAATGPAALQFFTSGTTGQPRCVSIGAAQLLAAIQGVIGRLSLTESDTSLSIVPLTHTLGLVTSVLAALAGGGAVAFADPHRARSVLGILAAARPTWCAASPSALRLVQAGTGNAGANWPTLRFLRSSSALLPDELADSLEGQFGVPVVNAYVMTEAPGEIASQDLIGGARRGTVGRPTLCEVEIRPLADEAAAGKDGQIWIRGPNVAAGTPASDGRSSWLRTGDVGHLDDAGFLRITGRTADVINQGGLKVWPAEVEAVALRHPDISAAVAFPIPHQGLGETVGLAFVARAGRPVDRSAVRRLFMSELPREKWPGTIVPCDQLPLTSRGKISRRRMWQLLGIEPR